MNLDRGILYLGRTLDTDEPLLYDAADLTTHGVIVGMTGSGKTGLGIGLIEEALLNGIPCLIIDPKGDMGNLALTFPDLAPADFEPWIDPAAADRAGKSVSEVAVETASTWAKGLEGHGIDQDRIRRLRDGAEVTIYTPGSGAGVGLNVLGSLAAPDLNWETDAEVIRDEIQSLVSSILTLAGVASDPVSGPEHILLATIVETLWEQGRDLSLETLVGQIPNPPFRKLGVFEIDTFISEKDRMALALKLNGLLASPAFKSWMEGVPLNIETMLGGPGPTKAAVVYLSHLSDEERQFLVTLLLSKMVTWIRSQPGTGQLRVLIYMDEVFGFAPPTANPPSKTPILTIFKQARAHGVGMILSTQNPVDIDYKAMSNAGTWMIGRLQTDNDKRRILEGLESASGAVDISSMSKLISDLDKRQFVLHTTKNTQPKLFSTRWAMSYLAGPLARDQVTTLMKDFAPPDPLPTNAPTTSVAGTAATPDVGDDIVPVAPKVATGVAVTYLDPAAPWAAELGVDPTATLLEPAVATTIQLLYRDAKAGINHREEYEAVVFPLDGMVDPEDVLTVDHDQRDFKTTAPETVSYRLPSVDIGNRAFFTTLESDLKDHLIANRPITVLRNPSLNLYSRVGEDREAFVDRCRQAAENAADAAMAKLAEKYKTRIDRVKDQMTQAETRLRTAESEVSSRRQQELIAGAGDLLGTLLGGRSRSNPLDQAASRRTASQRAGAKANAEAERVTSKQQELADLEDELAESINEIAGQHRDLAEAIEEVDVALKKVDVRVTEMKLVWVPVP